MSLITTQKTGTEYEMGAVVTLDEETTAELFSKYPRHEDSNAEEGVKVEEAHRKIGSVELSIAEDRQYTLDVDEGDAAYSVKWHSDRGFVWALVPADAIEGHI